MQTPHHENASEYTGTAAEAFIMLPSTQTCCVTTTKWMLPLRRAQTVRRLPTILLPPPPPAIQEPAMNNFATLVPCTAVDLTPILEIEIHQIIHKYIIHIKILYSKELGES